MKLRHKIHPHPMLFTPRSKKLSSSAAGERRLAAGNGHCAAFAKIASAGIDFRSHYNPSLLISVDFPCVTYASRRLNDAFPGILCSVTNDLPVIWNLPQAFLAETPFRHHLCCVGVCGFCRTLPGSAELSPLLLDGLAITRLSATVGAVAATQLEPCW